MKKTARLTIVSLAMVSFAFSLSTIWSISSDSYSIRFESDGASGTFKGFTGIIDFDESNLDQSKFDVRVDVNTINTGNMLKNRPCENTSTQCRYSLSKFVVFIS